MEINHPYVKRDFAGVACTDCAIWWANADDSGMDAETRLRVHAAANLASDETVIVGDEIGFTWGGCDVCGCRLGGDKHEVTITHIR